MISVVMLSKSYVLIMLILLNILHRVFIEGLSSVELLSKEVLRWNEWQSVLCLLVWLILLLWSVIKSKWRNHWDSSSTDSFLLLYLLFDLTESSHVILPLRNILNLLLLPIDISLNKAFLEWYEFLLLIVCCFIVQLFNHISSCTTTNKIRRLILKNRGCRWEIWRIRMVSGEIVSDTSVVGVVWRHFKFKYNYAFSIIIK